MRARTGFSTSTSAWFLPALTATQFSRGSHVGLNAHDHGDRTDRRVRDSPCSLMIRIVGYKLVISYVLYHIGGMTSPPDRQQDRAISLLKQQGIVRLSELTGAGITAATVSRMKEKGLVLRLGRGLYQLPGASLDVNHSLAQAAKLVPKGVVCLVTALAFHELTDTIPSRVWMAIGPKDRRPRAAHPPLQFVRFRDKMLRSGVEEHVVEGVRVRVYNPAKTVVDLFRYRQR